MQGRTARRFEEWLATYPSANTRDAYRRDVSAFAAWCAEVGRSPLEVSSDELARYRDHCLAAGAGPSTVARRLSSIASFLRFARDEGGQGNPVEGVARPTASPSSPVALDEGELAALLAAADGLGTKTAALVSLLALEGFRLNEVLAIDIPRLRTSPSGMTVSLRRRQEEQEVGLTARTAAAVTAHVGTRRRGPLFLGDSVVPARPARPARLSRFGADFLVKRAGASAGIDKSVSANVLRRSYVGAEHRAGTSLEAISRQVGHREVRQTARLLEGDG